MAVHGGGLEVARGGDVILVDALALRQHHGVSEHGFRITELGATSVPFGGQRRVLRNPVAFPVDAADQRMGLGIAGLGRFHGEFQGREIAALIEGLIGSILDLRCPFGMAADPVVGRGGSACRRGGRGLRRGRGRFLRLRRPRRLLWGGSRGIAPR